MSKAWFKPKSRGYGAVPSSWQGWLLVFLNGAVIGALVWYFWQAPEDGLHLAVLLGGALLSSILLVVIAKAKTDGEWRWRKGGDDKS